MGLARAFRQHIYSRDRMVSLCIRGISFLKANHCVVHGTEGLKMNIQMRSRIPARKFLALVAAVLTLATLGLADDSGKDRSDIDKRIEGIRQCAE